MTKVSRNMSDESVVKETLEHLALVLQSIADQQTLEEIGTASAHLHDKDSVDYAAMLEFVQRLERLPQTEGDKSPGTDVVAKIRTLRDALQRLANRQRKATDAVARLQLFLSLAKPNLDRHCGAFVTSL